MASKMDMAFSIWSRLMAAFMHKRMRHVVSDVAGYPAPTMASPLRMAVRTMDLKANFDINSTFAQPQLTQLWQGNRS